MPARNTDRRYSGRARHTRRVDGPSKHRVRTPRPKQVEAVSGELVAIAFQGLEEALAEELRELGATDIRPRRRAVAFRGERSTMYQANLWLRTALRVVQPIAAFDAADEQELYDGVSAIDWSSRMHADQTLAVESALATTAFTHSKYVALLTKDAVVDQFRASCGRRPSVDTHAPHLRIHVFIRGTRCVVSLDSSGDSLHRRGYRLDATEAPLNETTAAGLVWYSGWRGEQAFLDPMCGSGTIAIEAALLASRRAPGLCGRSFGFTHWPDFDPQLWDSLLNDARRAARTPACGIAGVDCDPHALNAAQANARRAGVADLITWRLGRIENLSPGQGPGTLVTNPPYGDRLRPAGLEQLYRTIGTTAAHCTAGAWRNWVLSASPHARQQFTYAGPVRTLYNGKLACVFGEVSGPAASVNG